jgi:hypothetical protein
MIFPYKISTNLSFLSPDFGSLSTDTMYIILHIAQVFNTIVDVLIRVREDDKN